MLKSLLVWRLASRYKHIDPRGARISVDLILRAMTEAIASGRRIEIRGFGSFTHRRSKPRKGRNPRTGETFLLPERPRIYFRATGDLRDRLISVGAGATRVRLLTPRRREKKVRDDSQENQSIQPGEPVGGSV